MKRRALRLLCYLIGALVTGSASAEDLHPGIIGKDDRVRVTTEGAPWDAIGQVNVSSYRMRGGCTGTLIAPDLVLTAAHCVVDRWSGTPFPPHLIHYLAGVRKSANQGHSTAKCLHLLKDYEFIAPDSTGVPRSVTQVPLRALLRDVAVIVLNDSMTVAPATLAAEAPIQPGLPLVHAAYPADRRYVLSADYNCRLLRSIEGPRLWLTDCDTHPASSGGPVFTQAQGALRLIAIMVATSGHEANIALPISEWRELIQARSCP